MNLFKKIFTQKEEIENKELLGFVGVWKSRYGSYLKITSSGKGDCEKIVWEGDKTSTKVIKNGQVNFSNGIISIFQTGDRQEFLVNREPYTDNGNTYLILDDIAFSKIA